MHFLKTSFELHCQGCSYRTMGQTLLSLFCLGCIFQGLSCSSFTLIPHSYSAIFLGGVLLARLLFGADKTFFVLTKEILFYENETFGLPTDIEFKF